PPRTARAARPLTASRVTRGMPSGAPPEARLRPPVPELPEVETVRDGHERFVVGAVVRDVEVFRDYSVRRHDGGPSSFRDQLIGRRLTAAVRRGKFLWLPLLPARPATEEEPAAAL